MRLSSRRDWLTRTAAAGATVLTGLDPAARECLAVSAEPDGERIAREAFDFIVRCRRDDGGYAASPDPGYGGESDTKLSDLAGVTYAAALAGTMGWKLPDPQR